jgi:hypothetical protein
MSKGFSKENKGDGGGNPDHYVKVGATKGMHGKSTGGHPSRRSTEFKDKGKGHHIKPITYKAEAGNE